jgi:hypothetical protein
MGCSAGFNLKTPIIRCNEYKERVAKNTKISNKPIFTSLASKNFVCSHKANAPIAIQMLLYMIKSINLLNNLLIGKWFYY